MTDRHWTRVTPLDTDQQQQTCAHCEGKLEWTMNGYKHINRHTTCMAFGVTTAAPAGAVAEHSPLPWSIAWSESRHRKDSYSCVESCGKGAKPIRVEHDTPKDAVKHGGDATNTELHVMHHDGIDDVLDANGKHVICLGHGYDDQGLIANSHDAALIVTAVNNHASLLAVAERLAAALEQMVDLWKTAQPLCCPNKPDRDIEGDSQVIDARKSLAAFNQLRGGE